MKKVLVTGGAGCIGTNLTKKLLSSGYEVVVVDNFITSKKENIRVHRNSPHFTFVEHDITTPFPKKLLDKLDRVAEVYHLACPTGVTNLVPLAEEMLLTCSLGTLHVLELARKQKAKLLLTSSSEVYGNPQVFPQSEQYTGNVDPIGLRSPYEEGKRFAESLVRMYVAKYGIDGKIVRVFNTYGPYMSDKDTRVIPTFLRQLKNKQPLTVTGRGQQTRTFCFVDDLVDGLLLIMKKGERGGVYNLGSDKEMKIVDLALFIKNTIDRSVKIDFIDRPSHDHNRRLPSVKKVTDLGWSQKTSLEDGLRRTTNFINNSL